MSDFKDPSDTAREILKLVEENDYENIIRYNCVHVRDSKTGNTPLHVAIQKNHLLILQYLLSQDKTAIHTENFDGKTPLVIAAEYGNYEAVRYLIEAGVDVNTTIHETTLLHLFVSNPQFVHFLILKNANLNAVDFSRSTPIHCVVREGCIETLCMLLYYNADPNAVNHDGLTPFMEAILERSADCQDILLKYIADFEIYSRNWGSLLDLALKCKSPYIKEIVNRGARVSNKTLFTFIYHCEFDEEVFKLIWDHLDYSDDSMSLILMRRLNLDKSNFENMLNIIIDSPNTNLMLKYVSDMTFNIIVTYFERYNCNIEIVTKFIFRLLENSYWLDVQIVRKLFHLYGSCELFRLLRYFEHEGEWFCGSGPLDHILRFNFDISASIKDIKQNFRDIFNPKMLDLQFCGGELYRRHMIIYFEYTADTQLISKCGLNEVNFPTVPKLIELARDASREYIIKRCNVSKTLHYYTAVDHLNIPYVCKDILKFNRRIYNLNY